MKSTHSLLPILGIVTLSAMATPLKAQDGSEQINIVMPAWDSGRLVASFLGNEIERHFGKKANFLDIPVDEGWVELDDPKGDIDIYPDIWLPNQQTNWSEYIEDRGSVLGNSTPYIGQQNLYYLKIDTLPDRIDVDLLTDPAIIKNFDANGNGKGEYWPGVEGWGSYTFTQVKFHNYGLNEFWEPLSLTTDDFLDVLADRKEMGGSILFYYWAPEWIHAEYRLGDIIEPPYEEGCQNIVDPEESADYLKQSTFMCEYPDSKVHIIYRNNIDEKGKGLTDFLDKFTVNPRRLSRALHVLYKQRDAMENALKILTAAPS